MQDRYAGDVGDFVKLGLLRAISPGRRLGVAWYRFPDEGHNGDGRHISYLEHPHEYEALDPRLFHHLRDVVSRERSIASLFPVLEAATSADESLDVAGVAARARRKWRRRWFSDVLDKLSGCDLVFADPDNGIIDDEDKRKSSSKFGKQIPLEEVRALASGRCAVIYHHNTRRPGGHDAEVDFWLAEIGLPGFAVRATRYSPRTFFVLNPDENIRERATAFCTRWSGMKVRIHP
jgi:hypothetical protein